MINRSVNQCRGAVLSPVTINQSEDQCWAHPNIHSLNQSSLSYRVPHQPSPRFPVPLPGNINSWHIFPPVFFQHFWLILGARGKKIIKPWNLSFPVCRSSSHAELCYIFSLTLRESGGPWRHTRPYKSPSGETGCLCTVMVCGGGNETFFSPLMPSCFFLCGKSNQPQCNWKSKWNLSNLFLCASLWFFTKKNTTASAHKDDLAIKRRWASACSPFLLRRNWKLSNKGGTAFANVLPFESGRGTLISDEKTI